MRRGIGNVEVEAVPKGLSELNREPIVVAVETVLVLINMLVARIDDGGGEVDRRRVGAHGVAACVIDDVGAGPGWRADVQVANRQKLQATAPDIGRGQVHACPELPLESERSLLGEWR